MYIQLRRQNWPLLKSEWVGSDESVLWARSRAGEARRSEPLTAITGPDNRALLNAGRALLNAGMVRHSAMEARARGCRTSCLKPHSALANRGTCEALISTPRAKS